MAGKRRKRKKYHSKNAVAKRKEAERKLEDVKETKPEKKSLTKNNQDKPSGRVRKRKRSGTALEQVRKVNEGLAESKEETLEEKIPKINADFDFKEKPKENVGDVKSQEYYEDFSEHHEEDTYEEYNHEEYDEDDYFSEDEFDEKPLTREEVLLLAIEAEDRKKRQLRNESFDEVDKTELYNNSTIEHLADIVAEKAVEKVIEPKTNVEVSAYKKEEVFIPKNNNIRDTSNVKVYTYDDYEKYKKEKEYKDVEVNVQKPYKSMSGLFLLLFIIFAFAVTGFALYYFDLMPPEWMDKIQSIIK